MTALILKDIATLKKTLLLTITICVALAIYGIYENAIFMIPLICAMIPLILTAISFGYDTKSNFEQYAFSMPIKKSSYVLSKLFFCLCIWTNWFYMYIYFVNNSKYNDYRIYSFHFNYYFDSKYSDVCYSVALYTEIRRRKR